MKGQKTGGRTAGTPNKVGGDTKEFILAILKDREHYLAEIIDETKLTNPIAAFKMMTDLMDFVVSKPKQMDVTTNGESMNTPQIIFQDISGKVINND